MKPKNGSSTPNEKQRSTFPVVSKFHRQQQQQQQHYNAHHTNPDMDIPAPPAPPRQEAIITNHQAEAAPPSFGLNVVVQDEAQQRSTPSEILLTDETTQRPLPEPVILTEEYIAVVQDYEASAAAGEASSSSRNDDELVEAVLVGAAANDDKSHPDHHDNIRCNNVQQQATNVLPRGTKKPLRLLQSCIPDHSHRGKMITCAFLAITILGILAYIDCHFCCNGCCT